MPRSRVRSSSFRQSTRSRTESFPCSDRAHIGFRSRLQQSSLYLYLYLYLCLYTVGDDTFCSSSPVSPTQTNIHAYPSVSMFQQCSIMLSTELWMKQGLQGRMREISENLIFENLLRRRTGGVRLFFRSTKRQRKNDVWTAIPIKT